MIGVGIREDQARTSPVRQETATVFRGGGRRFFTRKAAERAEAKAIIRKRCECERGDILNGDYGHTCRYHSDRDRYERAVRLLLAMFIRKGRTHEPRHSELLRELRDGIGNVRLRRS